MAVNTNDNVFEVYLRDNAGDTYHLPLREGLKEFLDPDKGYRISINIEGVVITLRNSWDINSLQWLDDQLGHKTVEVAATIRGL